MKPPENEDDKMITHEDAQKLSRSKRRLLGKRYGVKITGTTQPISKS